jgi:hypothetical protein
LIRYRHGKNGTLIRYRHGKNGTLIRYRHGTNGTLRNTNTASSFEPAKKGE